MPFVMMVGLPSSGKTYYTNILKDYLENQLKKTVKVISDEKFYYEDKNSIYMDSSKEKELRSRIKSEVQNLMSKDEVVLLDFSNYIKGFRYELYCISKLYQTPQCVIFTDTELDECIQLNQNRSTNEIYKDEVMHALNERFEKPETKNRWDSVLFTIQNKQILPFDEIANSLFNKAAAPPNKSTLNKPLSDTNFLHDMDKITLDIQTYILNLQSNQLASNQVIVPGASEKVKLVRPVTLAELRKWRQQFANYTKLHPPSDAKRIPNMFVEYINNLII